VAQNSKLQKDNADLQAWMKEYRTKIQELKSEKSKPQKENAVQANGPKSQIKELKNQKSKLKKDNAELLVLLKEARAQIQEFENAYKASKRLKKRPNRGDNSSSGSNSSASSTAHRKSNARKSPAKKKPAVENSSDGEDSESSYSSEPSRAPSAREPEGSSDESDNSVDELIDLSGVIKTLWPGSSSSLPKKHKDILAAKFEEFVDFTYPSEKKPELYHIGKGGKRMLCIYESALDDFGDWLMPQVEDGLLDAPREKKTPKENLLETAKPARIMYDEKSSRFGQAVPISAEPSPKSKGKRSQDAVQRSDSGSPPAAKRTKTQAAQRDLTVARKITTPSNLAPSPKVNAEEKSYRSSEKVQASSSSTKNIAPIPVRSADPVPFAKIIDSRPSLEKPAEKPDMVGYSLYFSLIPAFSETYTQIMIRHKNCCVCK
jgi:hypothetical protein